MYLDGANVWLLDYMAEAANFTARRRPALAAPASHFSAVPAVRPDTSGHHHPPQPQIKWEVLKLPANLSASCAPPRLLAPRPRPAPTPPAGVSHHTPRSLPPPIICAANRFEWIKYAFDRNYDCIISATGLDAQRLGKVKYMMPHQPYGARSGPLGARLPSALPFPPLPHDPSTHLPSASPLPLPGYVIVTNTPSLKPKAVHEILFAWTDPFLPSIWGVTMATLVFSTAVMYVLEGGWNEEDFGPLNDMLLYRLGRGLFKCMSTFAGVSSFSPVTPAGQTFSVFFSFSMLLIQSAYTANLAGARRLHSRRGAPRSLATALATTHSPSRLTIATAPPAPAAFFTRTVQPVTLITDITSFAQTNTKARRLAASPPCRLAASPPVSGRAGKRIPPPHFTLPRARRRASRTTTTRRRGSPTPTRPCRPSP